MRTDLSHLKTYLRQDAKDGGWWVIEKHGRSLNVIASWGEDWDHVSVSKLDRTPTWAEMQMVRELFFEDDEMVMQLHPPKQDYVNVHSYTLHLWRPQRATIPRPAMVLV